jgi:hypothetical protein
MRACKLAVAALNAEERQYPVALRGGEAALPLLRLCRRTGADERAQCHDRSKQRHGSRQSLDHDCAPLVPPKCGVLPAGPTSHAKFRVIAPNWRIWNRPPDINPNAWPGLRKGANPEASVATIGQSEIRERLPF